MLKLIRRNEAALKVIELNEACDEYRIYLSKKINKQSTSDIKSNGYFNEIFGEVTIDAADRLVLIKSFIIDSKLLNKMSDKLQQLFFEYFNLIELQSTLSDFYSEDRKTLAYSDANLIKENKVKIELENVKLEKFSNRLQDFKLSSAAEDIIAKRSKFIETVQCILHKIFKLDFWGHKYQSIANKLNNTLIEGMSIFNNDYTA
jgi:hypothetical protein